MPCLWTRLLWIFAVALAAVAGDRFATDAHAVTRLKDLHLKESGDRMRMFLLLDARPSYALSSSSPQQVHVTLLNTTTVEGIDSRVRSGESPSVRMRQKGGHVLLQMGFEVPMREVSGTWLPDERLLCIEFVESPLTGEDGSLGASPARLKHVRLGETAGRVRVVTEFAGRPRWEWSLLDERRVTLWLRETVTDLSPGLLKAVRGVSDARLQKTEGGPRLDLTLSVPGHQAKIFWLVAGKRLVADFGEGGSEVDLKVVDLPGDFGRKVFPAAMTTPQESPPASAPTVSAGNASAVSVKDSRPEDGVAEEPHIVKIRVQGVQPEAPAKHPDQVGGTPSPAPDGTRKTGGAQFDPRDLRPEEALLYGRILESKNFRDYERGSVLIAEFISRFPESPLLESVSFLKGDLEFLLLESGREEILPQMEATYKSAIDRFPDSAGAPRAYLRLSDGHRLAGNDYQAIGYLNNLISRYPQAQVLPQAYLQRGNIYLQGTFPEKALEDYKRLLSAYPGSPLAHEARYGIITYLHKKKLYEEAEKWMREMDQMRPDFHRNHPEYLSLRAQNHLYLKAYPEARRLFLLAINAAAQPETSDLLLTHIGDTYLHEGKEKEAQRVYRSVVEDFPGTEGSGISRLRLADFTSGTAAIQEVRDQHGNRPIGELAQLKMANVHFENDRYAEAMEALRALVASPGQNALHTAAKQLYYNAAKKELMRLHSEEHLEAFVQLIGDNEPLLYGIMEPELRLLEGRTLLRLGRFADAARAFEKLQATDLAPGDRGALYLNLAECHRAMGDMDKAMRIAEEGRASPVEDQAKARLTLLLADLRMEVNDLEVARHLYTEGIQGQRLLSPGEIARSYYHLGRILNEEGSPEKAREALRQALATAEKDREQRPLYSLILGEVGDSYFVQGKPAEASKAYQEAFTAGYGPEMNGYWGIKFRLAECHLRLGETQPAEMILREVLEEGDSELQGRAQIRLGALRLERQLRRLSIWDREGLATSAHVKP